jgi:leucyl/phenylalanyl-tRNA--protein transferase
MPLAILSNSLRFPDPRRANSEGLVAIGGDLSQDRLLVAYASGVFPWTVRPVSWWSPDPRAIFELDTFQPPRSLAKLIRKGPFQVTVDRAFRKVMEGCALPRADGSETWITSEFLEAYTSLHRAGHAHSVECWQDGELVGGIYGVKLGGFFAGESMFHRASNASKVALCELIAILKNQGFALFDIQMLTPVTASLGAVTIPRSEYLARLKEAVEKECRFMGPSLFSVQPPV